MKEFGLPERMGHYLARVNDEQLHPSDHQVKKEPELPLEESEEPGKLTGYQDQGKELMSPVPDRTMDNGPLRDPAAMDSLSDEEPPAGDFFGIHEFCPSELDWAAVDQIYAEGDTESTSRRKGPPKWDEIQPPLWILPEPEPKQKGVIQRIAEAQGVGVRSDRNSTRVRMTLEMAFDHVKIAVERVHMNRGDRTTKKQAGNARFQPSHVSPTAAPKYRQPFTLKNFVDEEVFRRLWLCEPLRFSELLAELEEIILIRDANTLRRFLVQGESGLSWRELARRELDKYNERTKGDETPKASHIRVTSLFPCEGSWDQLLIDGKYAVEKNGVTNPTADTKLRLIATGAIFVSDSFVSRNVAYVELTWWTGRSWSVKRFRRGDVLTFAGLRKAIDISGIGFPVDNAHATAFFRYVLDCERANDWGALATHRNMADKRHEVPSVDAKAVMLRLAQEVKGNPDHARRTLTGVLVKVEAAKDLFRRLHFTREQEIAVRRAWQEAGYINSTEGRSERWGVGRLAPKQRAYFVDKVWAEQLGLIP